MNSLTLKSSWRGSIRKHRRLWFHLQLVQCTFSTRSFYFLDHQERPMAGFSPPTWRYISIPTFLEDFCLCCLRTLLPSLPGRGVTLKGFLKDFTASTCLLHIMYLATLASILCIIQDLIAYFKDSLVVHSEDLLTLLQSPRMSLSW